MPKTILFVDEEQFIRKSLQRGFRDMQAEWRMLFAATPDEGLAIMDQQTVDVLVTEMAFIGQSGLDFLNAARAKHPQSARIILSGYVDRDVILKTVDLAHQFLSKPCDNSELKATIARALLMKELLDQEPIKKVVTRIDTLPSLPDLYQELVQALKSENASVQKVGAIIAKDMGLSAKLLKLVNSSFFGLSQRVGSPAQAVSLLGLDLVSAIVLASGTFEKFKILKFKGFSIERLWDHAMTTAVVAKIIAQQAGWARVDVDCAFTAGVLHDIGKLLIAAHLTDQFKAVVGYMQAHGCMMASAEMNFLGTTHAPIGAYLLGLWGLPDAIIDAAAFHHQPGVKSPAGIGFAALIHVADAFANAIPDLAESGRAIDGLDYSFLEAAGMIRQLPDWRAACARQLQG